MLFSEILGQKKAKKFLKQVIAREKMPHAYLFTGIHGIGKTSTARALSMALNCTEPGNGEGCDHCKSCRQMRSGNFPDFLSMIPDGQNIKIDQIRDLNHKLSFAPVSGKYRVCVVHHAETMTVEAANSFLKTLEEPPSGNILILNTTEPLDLLPTIVSRCQRISFHPIGIIEIANWLVKNREIDKETAMVLAKISQGSLDRALKMCEADFLNKRQEWLFRVMKLPGLSRMDAFEMAHELAGEVKKAVPDSSDTSEPGIMDMLAAWENWYRDLLLLSVGGPPSLLVNGDFSHQLKNMAGNYKVSTLIDSLVAIDQAQRDLTKMRNMSIVMEHVILSLKGLAEHGN